jgi:hypothetical protein
MPQDAKKSSKRHRHHYQQSSSATDTTTSSSTTTTVSTKTQAANQVQRMWRSAVSTRQYAIEFLKPAGGGNSISRGVSIEYVKSIR